MSPAPRATYALALDAAFHAVAAWTRHGRRGWAFLLLLLPLSPACASAARVVEPANVQAEIRRANDRFEANARAQDVERLVREYYDKQTVVAFGGQKLVKGFEEAKAAWKDMLQRATVKLETQRVEVGVDLASEMGQWTLRIEAEEGDFRQERGVYHVTWKKSEGQWKAAMETFFPSGHFGEVD